jgi:hypothetical protein
MSGKRLEVQEYSDSDLISGCLKGKDLHQEVLYKRYFSFAMSVCIRYTKDRNEAMEIVNDSYMKVLSKKDSRVCYASHLGVIAFTRISLRGACGFRG